MGRFSLPQLGGREGAPVGVGAERGFPCGDRGSQPAQHAAEGVGERPGGAGALWLEEGRGRLRGHEARLARQAPHERLQLVAEGGHRLVPVARRLRHRPVEDRLEGGEGPGVHVGDRARGGVDDRVQHLDRVAAAERGHAGDHLVEHDAEAEDVGAVVGGLARRLLRGAVAHRAVGHADVRQGIVGLRRRRRAALRGVRHEHLGEAEVEDPRLAAGPDDDVGGLEVAVDDPARVSHREGVGDLDRDRESGERLERPPVHELLEGRPFHVLQHDVVEAVRLPDVVDALDVRVVEGGAQGRLALEAPPRGLARGELRLQGLDHDGAAEPQVLGLEGGGLASLAQRVDDAVVRDRAAGAEARHRGREPL